jgi:hypothetical protein
MLPPLPPLTAAAAAWTSVRSDPIHRQYPGQTSPAMALSSPYIIGQTETITVTNSYDTVRNALVATPRGWPFG